VLTDTQKQLYARHVLLDELGAAGQARLCAVRVVIAPASDGRAAQVALDYLARGGVQVGSEHVAHENHDVDAAHAILEVDTASTPVVERLAGDAALLECAAWLSGAFAAVEAIKQIAGVGTPGRLDPELVLSAEVS
jgi:hypothetical protein